MMNQYFNKLEWPKNEEGQDLAEYGLLLGLIAVVMNNGRRRSDWCQHL
jgi:Flp pilus assembly pilin Flp